MGWAGALRSVGLVAALLATSSIVACGGGTSPPPDRGELVRMLVSADDLAGDWALDIGTKNGHVPDLEGWGPQPILCEAAGDAPAAPAVVAWEATRALEHAGRERWAYEIRVQEYLLASSARSARKTYDAFASSMRACAPRLPASSYSGRTTAIELPAVGDARAGIETSYLEKGAARPLAGDMRTVLVLDGTVLMAITLNETDYPEGRPWQPKPQIDDTELAAIVKTMVDKLH